MIARIRKVLQNKPKIACLLCCATSGLGPLASAQGPTSVPDPLLFPKDKFTLETKTIKTADGEKKVSYRLYQHVPYVTRPVDKEYESLDVKVPVTIDGISVHVEHAPILFVIGVGGYMSASCLQSSRRWDLAPTLDHTA